MGGAQDEIARGLMPVIATMQLCIEMGRTTPAVMLVYSLIDVMGSTESSTQRASEASFRRWVNRYLLKQLPLPCTSRDLYAARCSVRTL
jgi:hypothetical protein